MFSLPVINDVLQTEKNTSFNNKENDETILCAHKN